MLAARVVELERVVAAAGRLRTDLDAGRDHRFALAGLYRALEGA